MSKVSGPPIPNFEAGWALRLGSGGKAHYWRNTGYGYARSLCGRDTPLTISVLARDDHPALMEPGNWDRCDNCKFCPEGQRLARLSVIPFPNCRTPNT